MSHELVIYRPTRAARAAHRALGTKPLPREVHVHASGGVVACYEGHHADIHFATMHGVLELHGLTHADFEQIR